MLSRIQGMLSALYDLAPAPDVERFICGRELVAATVGEGAADRGEVLLVMEDEDGVHVALYLDPEVLDALREAHPEWPVEGGDFSARCLATEGVSHFLYLTFRADHDEQVSQLELELQAEVDKYAAGLLAGNGVGAIRERSRALRERLFEEPRFLDRADSVEGERYRLAHRAAATYAASLEARYVETGRLAELEVELRRFYRLGAQAKLRFIRST
ncbi:MAG: hypothetical protein VYE22_21890 [Myxococcota bacterium]|nr:hypothetical protein [Myxococcota bacterium]